MMWIGVHKSLKTYPVWNASELAGLCRERPAALSPAYAGEMEAGNGLRPYPGLREKRCPRLIPARRDSKA